MSQPKPNGTCERCGAPTYRSTWCKPCYETLRKERAIARYHATKRERQARAKESKLTRVVERGCFAVLRWEP